MLTLDGNDWLKSFQGLNRSLEADRSWSDGKRSVEQLAKGEDDTLLGLLRLRGQAASADKRRWRGNARSRHCGRQEAPSGAPSKKDGGSRHVLGGCQHIFKALSFGQSASHVALRIVRTHPVVAGVVQTAPTR